MQYEQYYYWIALSFDTAHSRSPSSSVASPLHDRFVGRRVKLGSHEPLALSYAYALISPVSKPATTVL